MAGHIWVKVVGFSDIERHSLNTLFRLSSSNPTSYALWSDQVAHPPQIAIIDFESYEAGLETSLPSFNANLKVIGVGAQVSDKTWRSFTRPVNWGTLIQTLGELFHPPLDTNASVDLSLGSTVPLQIGKAPGLKVALLVGFSDFDGFYLRARLALAGVADADVADTSFLAQELLDQHSYDVVLICLDIVNSDPWSLVKALHEAAQSGQSVIVTNHNPTSQSIELAEELGCIGLLEMPFSPKQVLNLFQKL